MARCRISLCQCLLERLVLASPGFALDAARRQCSRVPPPLACESRQPSESSQFVPSPSTRAPHLNTYATPCEIKARTECQVFVKNSTGTPISGTQDQRSKNATTSADEQELVNWLGGRDSNPDTVVQSHVSYRWTTSQCRAVFP